VSTSSRPSRTRRRAGCVGCGLAAGFTQAIKDQTKELHEARQERKHLAAAVKSLQDKLPGKVEDGARKGIAEREKRTDTG
jgi:hypothetical protein